jgi:hypothetical protein
MFGNFVTKTETAANATGAEANVSVGVNADGTIRSASAYRKFKADYRSQSSSFSGQCVPKKGKINDASDYDKR